MKTCKDCKYCDFIHRKEPICKAPVPAWVSKSYGCDPTVRIDYAENCPAYEEVI